MASFWEWVGEKVGYGLAAVVLGPGALVERKARRESRRAMLRFVAERGPIVFESPARDTLRRGGRLMVCGEPLDIELTLDLRARKATMSTAIESLPKAFGARVSSGLGELHGLRYRLPEPRAISGTIRVDSEDIDANAANELLQQVTKSPLGQCPVFELTLQEGRLQLLVVAPRTELEWTGLGITVIALSTWSTSKWRASYRG